MIFFLMTWANSCSGTREGNWGSPLSLRSLFPGSFVREQDTGEEMTCWLAAIIIQAYCSEQVVQLVYNNKQLDNNIGCPYTQDGE